MKKNNYLLLILTSSFISSCGYSPYEEGLKYQSLEYCNKITESMDKARCIEKTNTNYNAYREKFKAEKKKQEKNKLKIKTKEEVEQKKAKNNHFK